MCGNEWNRVEMIAIVWKCVKINGIVWNTVE